MSCVQSEHPKKHLKTRGRFGCSSDAVLSESFLTLRPCRGCAQLAPSTAPRKTSSSPPTLQRAPVRFFSSQLTSQSRAGLFTVELWIDSPTAFAAAAL